MIFRPRRLGAVAVALLLGTAGCAGLPGAAVDDTAPQPAVSAASPTGSSPADEPTSATRSAAPSTSSAGPSASPRATARPSARAGTAALLTQGDRGTRVRELQHRLRQLDWFSGDITGRYAASTVTAVEGFQEKRALTATGAVDQKTWTSLTSRTRKPTHDEMHNTLTPGPALMARGPAVTGCATCRPG